MKKTTIKTLLLSVLIVSFAAFAQESNYQAQTVIDKDLSDAKFAIMIGHLPKEKLFVEADAWLKLLEEAANDVAVARLAVQTHNESISETKSTSAEIEQEKVKTLEKITKLRGKRTAVGDRLNLILLEINERIGKNEDGTERDEVMAYRRYIDAVGGVTIDVGDFTAAFMNASGWLMSDQGGMRWIKNIALFMLIMFMTYIVSLLAKKAVRKAINLSQSDSQLFNDFILNIVHKIIMLAGVLIALSALEVNVGPIMAIVGAAGFVIAFALQRTLSNFASGIMIMLYRPYDIGDVIDVAGIAGKVDSMNLVSTSIMTSDNRLMVIPNNSIWGGVITNATASDTRRVDMVFGIGYDDDIDKAIAVMTDILEKHPLVLDTPAPTIRINELADSSVNFICRPWVKTPDYWVTLSEITRAVKDSFDAEGISFPYPQRDIHVIQQNNTTTAKKPTKIDVTKGFTSDKSTEISLED